MAIFITKHSNKYTNKNINQLSLCILQSANGNYILTNYYYSWYTGELRLLTIHIFSDVILSTKNTTETELTIYIGNHRWTEMGPW